MKGILLIMLPDSKQDVYESIKSSAYNNGWLSQCFLYKSISNQIIFNAIIRQTLAKCHPTKYFQTKEIVIGIDVYHKPSLTGQPRTSRIGVQIRLHDKTPIFLTLSHKTQDNTEIIPEEDYLQVFLKIQDFFTKNDVDIT